jgi:hypothetical protein
MDEFLLSSADAGFRPKKSPSVINPDILRQRIQRENNVAAGLPPDTILDVYREFMFGSMGL